jgi:hypothetical protein
VPCRCAAAESLEIFGEKGARRELRRYLRKGLGGDDAKRIVSWAEERGLDGATVAEIGGGIGQIQVELLRRGAAHGTVVEVVSGYEAPAGELAQAVAADARTSFVLADLLEAPDAVEPADIVVLRRVVCCSPRGPELLGIAAGKARRTLLVSYPRTHVANRAFARLQNVVFALVRLRFRVFVHHTDTLERAAAHHGLSRSRVARGLVWETAQFDVASS